jgi:hypothetical protein
MVISIEKACGVSLSLSQLLNSSTVEGLARLVDSARSAGLSGSVAKPEIVSVLQCKRTYANLVLVGHSEGGAVIRQCILDEINRTIATAETSSEKETFGSRLLLARLRLFAPALFGYSPSGLVGILVRLPFLGTIIDACLSASPSYQDLRYPSEFLSSLQEKTEQWARENSSPALRASVLWGRQEDILKVGRYEQDTIYAHVKGVRHSGICKPTERYVIPLEFVANE